MVRGDDLVIWALLLILGAQRPAGTTYAEATLRNGIVRVVRTAQPEQVWIDLAGFSQLPDSTYRGQSFSWTRSEYGELRIIALALLQVSLDMPTVLRELPWRDTWGSVTFRCHAGCWFTLSNRGFGGYWQSDPLLQSAHLRRVAQALVAAMEGVALPRDSLPWIVVVR